MAHEDLNSLYSEQRARAEAFGQGHVFRWWDKLSESEKRGLLEQVRSIDFDWLNREVERLLKEDKQRPRGELAPCDIVDFPSTPEEKAEAEQMYRRGEQALREGLVAPFLVAGGQGSRLGFDGPKGAYPIGPVTGKTLFQFQAEKIARVWEKYGRATRWYIMTSLANDAATRRAFEENDYFGLEKDRVRFFVQRMVPSVTMEGKIVMASRSEIFMNPNGTGGIYIALAESGSLDEMAAEGVRAMFYFQIDNLIVKVCEPTFIGYHFSTGAEMSLRVLEKRHAEEPLGVVGLLDGKHSIIEYSDLTNEEMHARDESGRLKYWAASPAIHVIDVEFARRQTTGGFKLEYHRAKKKVPRLDDDGNPIDDPDYMGIKFETFVFDAMPDAKGVLLLQSRREREFSPIKNASGEDSPESARAMAKAMWTDWLVKAGLPVPAGEFEISPRFAQDERDFLERVKAGDDPRPFIFEKK